jgi:hypothetical protein
MTDAEFAQLVTDAARTAERFTQIEAGPFRIVTPALPADGADPL